MREVTDAACAWSQAATRPLLKGAGQSEPDTCAADVGRGNTTFCTRTAEPDRGAERLPGSPCLRARAGWSRANAVVAEVRFECRSGCPFAIKVRAGSATVSALFAVPP